MSQMRVERLSTRKSKPSIVVIAGKVSLMSSDKCRAISWQAAAYSSCDRLCPPN